MDKGRVLKLDGARVMPSVEEEEIQTQYIYAS
jgi:hypothetical protein